MPKKRLGVEQIVTKLRQVEVMQSQGKSVAAACKEAGLTEQSYYRYRKECGDLNVELARKLKQLEQENGRLKKLVADLSLEDQFLKDIAKGNL
jgi:ACT domain-containing protein